MHIESPVNYESDVLDSLLEVDDAVTSVEWQGHTWSTVQDIKIDNIEDWIRKICRVVEWCLIGTVRLAAALWGIVQELPLKDRFSKIKADKDESADEGDNFNIQDAQEILGKVVDLFAHLDSEKTLPETRLRTLVGKQDYVKEALLTLMEDGEAVLLERLVQDQSVFWKDLDSLPSFQLQKQSINLAFTLFDQTMDNQSINDLMEWVFKACQDSPEEGSRLLGALTFIVDRDVNGVLKSFSELSSEEFKDLIYEKVNQSFLGLDQALDHKEKAHKKTGVQQADLAKKVASCVELARLAVTRLGILNTGILPSIQEHFLSDLDASLNHDWSMAYGLKVLSESADLQAYLKSVRLPKCSQNPSLDLLKVTLGKSVKEKLSHADARIGVLSALLSHLRQGQAGSCFATFYAIGKMGSHLLQAAYELGELIQRGSIRRMFEGKEIDFPFLLKFSGESMDVPLLLSGNGVPLGHGTAIWEDPGIIAALNAVGKVDVKSVIQESIEQHFSKEKSGRWRVTVRELLDTCINNLIQKGTLKEEERVSSRRRMACAVESVLVNPILRAWENSLAGMAQADLGGFMRPMVLQSILVPFQRVIRNSGLPFTEKYGKEFLNAIFNELMERVELIYDPQVQLQSAGNDARSMQGAFVLCDKKLVKATACNDLSHHPESWQRIESASDFQNFVMRTLDDVEKEGREKSAYSKAIFSRIRKYVSSQDFLRAALLTYDLSLLPHLQEENWARLPIAPWSETRGGDSEFLLEVALNRRPEMLSLKPKSTSELLVGLLSWVKDAPKELREAYRENSKAGFPVRLKGVHAFSLLLGQTALSLPEDHDWSPEEWVKIHVEQAGRALASSKVSKLMRKHLIQHMKLLMTLGEKDLEKAREKKAEFESQANALPDLLSITEFRTYLLEILEKVGVKDISSLRRNLDDAVLRNLTKKQREELIQSSLCFADLNWSKGLSDLHLCAAVNPGSGELELMQVTDSGQGLRVIDQSKWLLSSEWRLCAEGPSVFAA